MPPTLDHGTRIRGRGVGGEATVPQSVSMPANRVRGVWQWSVCD